MAMADESADEWDLENALARAILGDIGDGCVAPTLRSASIRDEVEEERLIERLHARLFPAQSTTDTIPCSRQPKSTERSTVLSKQTTMEYPEATIVPARRSISPEKIDQMVARFRLHEAKRSRKIATLKQETVATSNAPLSSVRMRPRSRELMSGKPSFHERQQIASAVREQERTRQRQREQLQQQVMKDALALAVRTPCICGIGIGSDIFLSEHTPACARFLNSCENMKQRNKKQEMRRTVGDLLQSHEKTKRKHTRMAEIQRRLEEQETTFTPQLNQNSIKIYKELVKNGRLEPNHLMRVASSPPPPSSPTQPPLGVKSKLVFMPTRRRSSITSHGSIGSRSSGWINRRIRSGSGGLPQVASFSESHYAKQTAAVARKDTPPASPLSTPFVIPCTTVTYEPTTCDFILAHFDHRNWFR